MYSRIAGTGASSEHAGSHSRADSRTPSRIGIHTWRTTRTASGSSRTTLNAPSRSFVGPAGPGATILADSPARSTIDRREKEPPDAPHQDRLHLRPRHGERAVRAAVLYEYGQPLVVQELDLEEPRAGEILVRMVASGVCHSDLHSVQ